MNPAPANGANQTGGGKTLAPAFWDRLKAQAAELGGVARGSLLNGCLHGVALRCDGVKISAWLDERPGTTSVSPAGGEVSDAVVRLFTDDPQRYSCLWQANDNAVDNIVMRSNLPVAFDTEVRVDFESLMAELGVVRGEEVAQ